ncbi:hypothetical protein Lal_00038618 [Lupinus albus]|nr:hypothetical protein Lal_00041050 [Lupinus albus]KAF1856040.1 hypothetical protein Lal_00041051 [Lupinus albus]KAF1881974.1 hypothetical protein Lal_00038618 [Lupinus albus]
MGSSSRRSVPKGNQIPKLSPSSSSFPAAAATKGTTATTVVLSLVTVSVATTTPGSSGGCDERQRRRLGKPLMAMMAILIRILKKSLAISPYAMKLSSSNAPPTTFWNHIFCHH